MTLASLKSGAMAAPAENGAVIAEFLDGERLSVAVYYLPGHFDLDSWEEGRELTAREEEAFRFAAACFKAEKAALRSIARAEQNSTRLISKLEQKGHRAAVVHTVVSRLADNDLVNDERYAELWLRSRLSQTKKQSPLSLLVSLGKRGVDRNTSRRALEKTLDPDTEYFLLLKYLEKTGVSGDETSKINRGQLKKEGFSTKTLDRFYDLL